MTPTPEPGPIVSWTCRGVRYSSTLEAFNCFVGGAYASQLAEANAKLEAAEAKRRSAELGLEEFQRSAAVVEERIAVLRDQFGQIADCVQGEGEDLEADALSTPGGSGGLAEPEATVVPKCEVEDMSPSQHRAYLAQVAAEATVVAEPKPHEGSRYCCHKCFVRSSPPTLLDRMILCSTCGNKRCPRANDHRNGCSGSNEPGQTGSAYEHAFPPTTNADDWREKVVTVGMMLGWFRVAVGDNCADTLERIAKGGAR